MEVNANPSLNVYSEKEGSDGEVELQLSEIDKFVKSKLVADTIDLIKTAPLFDIKPKPDVKLFQSASVPQLGCLRQII